MNNAASDNFKQEFILCLASWYPNRTDPYSGDFVERHVQAIARYRKVIVLFVTKDKKMQNANPEIERIQTGENLLVYKVYYRKSFYGWIEKIFSWNTYVALQKKMFYQITQQYGNPDLIHVHIALKAGLPAFYIKKKYQIKYIISEHWTGYNRNAKDNIYKNRLLKTLVKKILSNTALLLPVTKDLGEMINNDLIKVPYRVVPNVVNTDLFFYKPQENKKFKFIHVSSMNAHKNIEGIINAAKSLADEAFEFELLMIGWVNEKFISLAHNLIEKEIIHFKNEMPYEQVAKEMQGASAFVLFSTVENLPCVIVEALCCGLPVISSNVGGIKEVINESNGLLVKSKDEQELKEGMKKVMLNYNSYNRLSIAQQALAKFNYPTVGKQFDDIYKAVNK